MYLEHQTKAQQTSFSRQTTSRVTQYNGEFKWQEPQT